MWKNQLMKNAARHNTKTMQNIINGTPIHRNLGSLSFSSARVSDRSTIGQANRAGASMLLPHQRKHRSDGSRRRFSDRLMGYSPMAPSTPNTTPSPAVTVNEDGTTTPVRRIPTAEDVSTSGGVWAPTSAKRDKLAELKIALEEGQETLDDAATAEQQLDLFFSDGIQVVAKTVDSVPADLEATPCLQEFSEWLVTQQEKAPEYYSDDVQYAAHLAMISEKIDGLMATLPPAEKSLPQIRDFFDPAEGIEEEMAKLPASDQSLQDQAFEECVLRFRLVLAKAAVEHLQASWSTLTTLSDGDVDRAAVKGEGVQPQVVSLSKLYKFVFAHAAGTCSERVDAAWELLDRDEDGLLDESEMNEVARLCLTPLQAALVSFFGQALEVAPARSPFPELGSDSPLMEEPKGWRQRRKDAKAKKALTKMFQKSVQNHFEDEVEINHRLRCIYAWAEKEHQNNKLDSVLVDNTQQGWSGRKRYVELAPKISLEEFREVQQVHFAHFDRMGKEILGSFREDLWVLQGKGRQNQELMRDCALFLTVVSIADYFILMS